MAQAVQTSASRGQKRGYFLSDREGFLGSVFLAPAVLYILLLVGLPFVLAILYSLTDVTVGDTSLDFIGLENFSRAIRNNFV